MGMTTEEVLENLKKSLKNHNQGHLLTFWSRLSQSQKQSLLKQIQQLDFEKIDDWIADYVKKNVFASIPSDFTPAWSYAPVPGGPEQQKKYAEARIFGQKLISAGKVAAFVVAGGQGTRLGFDGPKGDFHISPVKNKTLFQIFAESIAAASEKYDAVCPWYIMTSLLNYSETIEIFQSNDYYGLDKKNIFIFQQGTMPNFGFDGKILLADKDKIASSPD